MLLLVIYGIVCYYRLIGRKVIIMEKPKNIEKWNMKDFEWARQEGYSVIPCDSEDEAFKIKELLKANKKCARVGWTDLLKDKDVCIFVLTKDRVRRGGTSGQNS